MNKKLTIIVLITAALSFFAGMEYRTYQIKSALSSVFNTDTQNTSEKDSTTVMEKAKEQNMTTIQKKIGDEVVLSSLALKVSRVEEQQIISSSYSSPKTAKEGSKFIIVDLEVTNNTKSVFTFYPDEGLLLIDDKGREFKAYDEAIGNIENYLNVRELSPSVKETGVIVYELPKDAKKYILVTSKAGSKELYKITLK